jgi:hypothetical protein
MNVEVDLIVAKERNEIVLGIFDVKKQTFINDEMTLQEAIEYYFYDLGEPIKASSVRGKEAIEELKFISKHLTELSNYIDNRLTSIE